MRALCWTGVNTLSVETVDDPVIVNPHDAILEVSVTTTCGSDLHFLSGYLPGMREGDVIGHEFMGRVVEVGAEVTATSVGSRVVVPSFIACNNCWYCDHEQYSLCDTTNPNADLQRPIMGYPTGGIYGYTHPFGGYQGSHAQYIRVPFADQNCFAVPDGVTDEQALFASDAIPTGYMGADFCSITGGETIAVWGAGGVGLMAARSAQLMGAGRVIVVDRIPERLAMARDEIGAETVDYTASDSVTDEIREMTGGRGPDAVIEAVGMEGHGTGVGQIYDKAKQALRLESDRATALREAIRTVRKGGVVSVLGVYGVTDKFPMGLVMNKGLTLRSAQQHGQRYVPRLLDHLQSGELDPTFLITHDMSLEESPAGYAIFKEKADNCVRAIFRP
ncbi:glutathione-dependent formaldehyde dehydrogenase [Rhodococcus sp. BP-349]|uniref:zinc-dependent alcohol dehydrogenase n=1 Tax=unclassified Rhodococcus (in: high G+C Gram-positive bacteria) TaxID=192944 RepID=UPI001C9AE88D|nr:MULTISPECIES: zinc-dependent alcohol dehydrogenase [unclassified Rhodococcus (in: high G+C Gram-positive bacteria)]MBY6539140.1 glutathione-dependent formaldehyde dehydrogenase [Rhodococcus sp. BP-363]MBY6544532.1 glutathione-dependent formaldehyde dehydrogenase [Rhodococcus sp. BP-369]MBY6563762.1 glutathione-dependent formaldehyde dehydrogenase [Rhodococcus sp. BP-370]MBY6578054.1 glutathione-dependent formaldehyde dehydrogenase [Rhodococcus sp. BP-364]MBY6587355.1 glutathione-dependent f